MLLAMDDRDRAAPIALTRNAPIAQAVVHLAFALRRVAEQLRFQPAGYGVLGFRNGEAVQEVRMDKPPILGRIGLEHWNLVGIFRPGCDHPLDRQMIFGGELEVALVMRRAAEDGACPVLHQHEICDVDRQRLRRVERMHDREAGIITLLFGGLDRGRTRPGAPAFLYERGELGIACRQGLCQRMVRGDCDEGRAEQSVRTGRINFDLGRTVHCFRQREADMQALGAADPILLHQPDFVRPAVERLERREQLIGEIGDFEEPLGQLAQLYERTRAPAATVDHLLVGQDGLVHRVPVHLRLLAVDEAGLEEVEEQALLVAVVGGVAGRDLAVPVERQAHALQLVAHGGDVRIGPFARMNLVLHRRIFSRQTEGIPPHRVQDVEAFGPLHAGDDIAHGVVSDMAHMDAPRRIGEHLQHVIFRTRIIVLGREGTPVGPGLLPFRFGVAGVVALRRHLRSIPSGKRCGHSRENRVESDDLGDRGQCWNPFAKLVEDALAKP